MIAWYIVPYKLDTSRRVLGAYPRYPAIFDYKEQILAAGGDFKLTEILGNRAIVKLRAPENILALADAKYKRLPKERLDDSLSDLPEIVKTKIRDEILDQGYTIEEIRDKFGDNLGDYTLRDVLKFMATRRKRRRYDFVTDQVIFDGPDIPPPKSLEEVDEVQE